MCPKIVGLMCVGLWLCGTACPATASWGARSKGRVNAKKTRKKRPQNRKNRPRKSDRTQRLETIKQLPVDKQVELMLASRWAPAQALSLLRLCVTRHQMKAAAQIAEALLARKRISPTLLAEAAEVLGSDHRNPLKLRLWERVAKRGRLPGWMRPLYEQGHFDALLAQGHHDKALSLLNRALRRARAGRARPLWERLVTWGQSTGNMREVQTRLRNATDPDAAILASKLALSEQSSSEGLAVLKRAFRRFPGHRLLQQSLMQELSRRGDRSELRRVITKVVRLNPSDPRPWLAYIDAAIVARDLPAAQRKIDGLLKRYRRHELLIEALIDREQTIGDDRKRIQRMFEMLLKAAPEQPNHIEAYVEWLFNGSQNDRKRALIVLNKLTHLPKARYDGLSRSAAILTSQRLHAKAEATYRAMLREYPQNLRTYRGLAQLLARVGRQTESERAWLTLVALKGKSTPERRQLATEARQGVLELYRSGAIIEERAQRLIAQIKSNELSFGSLLLLIDLDEDQGYRLLKTGFDDALPQRLKKIAMTDAQYLRNRAKAAIEAVDLKLADALTNRLETVDSSGARRLRIEMIERALQRGEGQKATELERNLLQQHKLSARQVLRLADLHLSHDRRRRATALIRRAAELDPTSTTPLLRLASILRQSSERDEETAVVRRVIARSVDTEEIQRAGQRLLTLTMMSGDADQLLQWINQVSLRHPRRELIDRFRLLAYDVWLRSAQLSRALGQEVKDPPHTHLRSALTSADLALRVRALRQLISTKGTLPIGEAKKLLSDSSHTIRLLVIAALANSNSKQASELLAAQNHRGSWTYRVGLFMALSRLPHTVASEKVLIAGLSERSTMIASMAIVGLARIGTEKALHRLLQLSRRRARLKLALAIAMGAIASKVSDEQLKTRVVERLAGWLHSTSSAASARLSTALLWGLAALASTPARTLLMTRIVALSSSTQAMASLRLYAQSPAPSLSARVFEVDIASLGRHDGHHKVIDAILAPWIMPTPEQDQQIGQRLSAELLPKIKMLSRSQIREWCKGVDVSFLRGNSLWRLCSPHR